MAIQNFLSGGYYGKLGQTVGQRWKNKRTIRAYVIPHNPRTVKQQANRGQFGSAVLYSQMGMQMNYLATCFDTTSHTMWNARMSTARDLKKAGYSGLDLIPLYPMTFTPPFVLTGVNIRSKDVSGLVKLNTQGTLPGVSKNLACMFDIRDASNVSRGLKLYKGIFDPDDDNVINIEVEDIDEINANCLLRAVSYTDTDSSEDMFVSAQINLNSIVSPVVDNWVIPNSANNILQLDSVGGHPEGYIDMQFILRNFEGLSSLTPLNTVYTANNARVEIYANGTKIFEINIRDDVDFIEMVSGNLKVACATTGQVVDEFDTKPSEVTVNIVPVNPAYPITFTNAATSEEFEMASLTGLSFTCNYI